METDTLKNSKSIFQNVLDLFKTTSIENREIRRKVAQERERIRKLSADVVMRYNDYDDYVRIGTDWVKQAKGVHSIVCSLNSPDCTVINVIFSEEGVLKPHKHDTIEYVFVASGSIKETVSGKLVNEGESMVIPPRTSHGWQSNGAKLIVVWRPNSKNENEFLETISRTV